jgi:hypothetical protein
MRAGLRNAIVVAQSTSVGLVHDGTLRWRGSEIVTGYIVDLAIFRLWPFRQNLLSSAQIW